MEPSDTDLAGAAVLAAAGIQDREEAHRRLMHLAGNGVTDDAIAPLIPLLLLALADSPDPDRSLASFARWFAAVGSPASHLQFLLQHPAALRIFCLVTGSSQYFAEILARHPEYFEIIANPGVRGGTRSSARFLYEGSFIVDACQRPELKKDALRRWKAREMLRIGVRDLAGLADMPSTAREFSNLADACAQKALDIAVASIPGPASPNAFGGTKGAAERLTGWNSGSALLVPFAIIGMGKLGGQELNYSSDIDLMFVIADDLPDEIILDTGRRAETSAWLNRLAETVIKALNEDTSNGHVFRVDMRLRPEGRFGSLIRSLSSYRAYYENWAENWERQALIKARYIAGDRALGEDFTALVEPFVYRSHFSEEFAEDIRANKRRIENQCDLEGQSETNIKTGVGGIRDIEFIVQLMQLQYGGQEPRLRARGTLSALQRLHHAGHLTGEETRELADDYQFLRTLEHRLQLLHGFQTQTLPEVSDGRERLLVARRMGFPTSDAFEAALNHRRQRVRGHLQHLFYADRSLRPAERSLTGDRGWSDVAELLDGQESPRIRELLAARLTTAGFRDIETALSALQAPMRGNEFGGMPPDTPEEFRRIAPRLLGLLSRGADPDAGLAGVEAIALAVPNRAQLYASFDDSPDVLAKLVTLASVSPPLVRRLCHHLEWMEGLFAEAEETMEPSNTPLSAGTNPDVVELSERLRPLKSQDAKLEQIARYYLRQTLRIGAADIWEEADVRQVMAALTELSEGILHHLVALCSDNIVHANSDPSFARQTLDNAAILGLGKLGGQELSYASDLDIQVVYDTPPPFRSDERGPERFALVSQLVEKLLAAGKRLQALGANIELDLRLRPWGRKGALANSPAAYIEYFRTSGETWERQAALKGRFVAGNPGVGRRFERIMNAVSFGHGLSADEETAVTEMKKRIETERLKPGQRGTDLKLGYGGLTDIEWLVQKLQMEHGKRGLALRKSNTLHAVSALASARLLENAEADALTETYLFLTRLRNRLYLQNGHGHDVLPEGHPRRVLARHLGYGVIPGKAAEQEIWEDLAAHMSEARRIFELRFYNA